MPTMIYVSAPYTSDSRPFIYNEMLQIRFEIIAKYTAQLCKQGHTVQSPVVLGHTLCCFDSNMPKDYGFWGSQSLDSLKLCDELHVLSIRGWKKSTGVIDELRVAAEMGIPCKVVHCSSDTRRYRNWVTFHSDLSKEDLKRFAEQLTFKVV